MIEFERTDTYKITSGKEKLKEDAKVLIRLYQPIIGAIAANLYLTFQSEITLNAKFTPSINHLLKNMHITIREFNISFQALLKCGLLDEPKRKKNMPNSYLFKALPTLNANDFFLHEELNNALKANVSIESYDLLRRSFTSDFVDDGDYEDVKENEKNEVNEETFYMNLLLKYSSLQSAINDRVKKEVSRIKKLFDVKYEIIEKCLLNSVEENNNGYAIDLSKFDDLIEENSKTRKPKDQMEEFIDDANNTIPAKYYERVTKRQLTPTETRMINNILVSKNIGYGVLNIIINYANQKNAFEFGLNPNYISKIVDSVKLNGCIDAASTMTYFKSLNKINKKTNINKEEYATIKVANKLSDNDVSKTDKEDDDAELLALLG